jgi:NADPH:quinone reductase
MKAVLPYQPGGPSALEYVEVPTPVPGGREVLVKADTIGVSMPEVLVRRGVYNWMPPLPAILGIDMSGTVVTQGRNVAEPAIGQPVFVSARDLPARSRWRRRAPTPQRARRSASLRSTALMTGLTSGRRR